jgi:hypothetical protein
MDREDALDVAADAILHRARLYDGTEPELARALRNIVMNMSAILCEEPALFREAYRQFAGYSTKERTRGAVSAERSRHVFPNGVPKISRSGKPVALRERHGVRKENE